MNERPALRAVGVLTAAGAAVVLGLGCNLLLDIGEIEFQDLPAGGQSHVGGNGAGAGAGAAGGFGGAGLVAGAGGHGGTGGHGGSGLLGGSGGSGLLGGSGGAAGSGGSGGTAGPCAGQPAGTPCGDPSVTDCSAADSCDDGGACVSNDEPIGTPCGDSSTTECSLPDTCDGSGSCLANHEPSGTACGSPGNGTCTDPDSCDGSGTCLPNHEPPGTPCGDSSTTECTNPDSCSANGTCLANHEPNATACGDSSDTDCTDPDRCTDGICQSNDAADGVACDDCSSPPCAACSAGLCVNSTDSYLDVGPFGSDYAQSAQSRGYYLTAPVNFTIVGLRVPTDVGTLAQSIQVVRFNSMPVPTYTATTTDHTTLGYYQVVEGTDFITVDIPVLAGETIGILGVRGTTTVHSSYGQTNSYATTILGEPVTLYRLRYDGNLAAGPAGGLATETNFVYARIEMIYAP